MTFARYYDYDHDFVVTVIDGVMNDDNLMKHVIELNEATKSMVNMREFGDATGITDMSELTAMGASRCATHESHRPTSKLAILVSDNPVVYGMARAYQTFSMEKREDVQIFHTKVEALAWLADDDDDLVRMIDFIAKEID